jgi:uncharacterized membrane protein YozB (DUF420 family)
MLNLPFINALLNGAAAILLVCGWFAVRAKKIPLHRALMGTAFATSALFLIGYLLHHYQAGGHVAFTGVGPVRRFYFAILITHTPLAVIVPVAAIRAIWLARAGRIEEHRRLARWTLPVWLYVSVTGVLVYLLLYQVAPALAPHAARMQ